MYIYSDPSREGDKWSLPDVEVFYIHEMGHEDPDRPGEYLPPGWYYWYCFPGCMPEGDPNGPFKSEQVAIDAARDEAS